MPRSTSPSVARSVPARCDHATLTPRDLRVKRILLMRNLKLAEWEFDRSPTQIHAALCAGLRLAISGIEARLAAGNEV